jgi:hypothetical protein
MTGGSVECPVSLQRVKDLVRWISALNGSCMAKVAAALMNGQMRSVFPYLHPPTLPVY